MLMTSLAFCGGLIAANVGEWVIHKYVLHGLGKKKDSFWSFHWKTHHRNCRKHDFHDPDYDSLSLTWNAQTKELVGLLGLAILVSPLMTLSIPTVLGLWTSMVSYYVVHKVSHVRPEWAKKWLKHHYAHHMGRDQDMNWCVSFPLTDWIMRTREKT